MRARRWKDARAVRLEEAPTAAKRAEVDRPRSMEPEEWLQSRATGRGRPNNAAALEAYRAWRKAEKEKAVRLAET